MFLTILDQKLHQYLEILLFFNFFKFSKFLIFPNIDVKLIRFKVSAPKNYKWTKEGGGQLIFACFRGENGMFILKVICRGILSCKKVEFCMLPGTKWIFHFKVFFRGENSFLQKSDLMKPIKVVSTETSFLSQSS